MSPQIKILSKIIGCDCSEITQFSQTVYGWKGVYYEVVGAKSKTAPASHYASFTYGGKLWSFRELGEKSKIMKQLKEQHGI